jgi:CheY-like chemotaxis protein
MKPILQVEDDPNDAFFLKRAMDKAGVTNPINVATDGQQAIDYLKGAGKYSDRELFPLPCLVLLDLKLPYVMGLEVLTWIRSHALESLVVVILTASADATDVATAYRLGANAFLIKPSEASKLESIAKAIKDFWLAYNVLPEESPVKNKEAPLLPARAILAQKRKRDVVDGWDGQPTTSKQRIVNNISA